MEYMTYICTIKLIKPIIMKVVAITVDGYQNLREKNVKAISTGARTFTILSKSIIDILVAEAITSGQMAIYDTDYEKLDGKLDANDATPLFTNGQVLVKQLLVDDVVVWSR